MVKNRGGENGIIFPGGENGISPSLRVYLSFDFSWLSYEFIFVTLQRFLDFDLLVLAQSATQKSDLLAHP